MEKERVHLIKYSLILLIISVVQVSCDYYTSVVGLEHLLESESYLLGTYESYLKQVEHTHQKIKNFIDEVEENIQEIKTDPETYYGNPLNVFKTLKRIAIVWKVMEETILLDLNSKEFSANFTNMISLGHTNVTVEDLFGASMGLARLQKTYLLSSADIADGVLMGYKYDSSLSAHDCFTIGRNLFEAKNYNSSVEWLLQARLMLKFELQKLNKTDKNNDKIRTDFPYLCDVDILEILAPSMFHKGNYKLAKLLNEELLAQEPTNPNGLKNKELFESHIRAERNPLKDLPKREPPTSNVHSIEDITDEVCRGSVRQTPTEQRNLRCRYVNNNVPFCLIAPFKMEELSNDPFVTYFHDVIYENEIQGIINRTANIVERSKVSAVAVSTASEVRISKTAWLYYSEHNSFLDPIRRRLEHMTGLSIDSAEELQVVNYGIGGHYAQHYDFSKHPDKLFPGQGNRILTALFYINEVELGGATAFPFLRLAVPPVKGSSVVWYNLHESMEPDYRTRHSGCPVLKGSKWISTQWFHEVGQEFTKPCSLERVGEISLPYLEF